jgi:2-oxoglutarate dehydrogenase E2 component (dihydrolipoamide succinyltransferase)
MPVNVTIPSLGESITEVVLSKWHKQSGDWIEKDENLYEIESDKITTDVPATESGVVTLQAKEGAELPIGAVIAKIDTKAARPNGASTKLPKKEAKPEAREAAAPTRRVEQSKGHDGAAASDGSSRATPVARRIAEEKGVDLGRVRGTGPSGRVTKEDVIAASDQASHKAETRPASAPALAVSRRTPDARNSRREKMSKLRQKIAERLVHAKNATAMLTTFNECDMSAVMALRAQYKDAFERQHGIGLGFMSFFVKACVSALQKFSRANASIIEHEIEYHDFIDISVAVSTERGLVVPVVRDADLMDFAQIESAIRALALKARDGDLTMDDITGGTFTITNGGIYGSLNSTPILNPPQSAILGMHAIKKRPIEDPQTPGTIVLRPMMNLALSYDHRIIDGAEAVSFLVHVKECIEMPGRLLLGV